MSSAIRPQRLMVSGGSELSPASALLWRELGRLLAADKNLIVVTGGFENRLDRPEALSADFAVIQGMQDGLRGTGTQEVERIETVLPDRRKDWQSLRRFHVGNVRFLEQRNAQARRFRMVHSTDVVVTIEGDNGTRSVLDVALAIERPFLPVPFGGGKSAEYWNEHKEDIKKWFELKDEEVAQWTATNLDSLDKDHVRRLAKNVHDILLRGFAKTCFVIMTFHPDANPVYEHAICPALDEQKLRHVRTDKHVFTGNVIAAIRDCLRQCSFAIADTTSDSPNVMYELGMAHARDKPVILLRREQADGSIPRLPFDLQTESVIRYSQDLNDLHRRLVVAIETVCGVIRRTEVASGTSALDASDPADS